MNDSIKTAPDLAAELHEILHAEPACVITDEGIVIKIPGASGQTYPIALSRCDSYEKIVGWVIHLYGKKWVTASIIGEFVHLACSRHGLDPFPSK